MKDLEDDKYKKLSDAELINIIHSKVSYYEDHKKAVYELHRRQKEFETENKNIQHSIKRMTFWILLVTILLLIIAWIQLFHFNIPKKLFEILY